MYRFFYWRNFSLHPTSTTQLRSHQTAVNVEATDEQAEKVYGDLLGGRRRRFAVGSSFSKINCLYYV
jgi:hypothetical protein